MANRRQGREQTNKPANQQTKEAQSLKPKVQSSLDIAVLKTLAYADVFDQALGVEELWRLWLGARISFEVIDRRLNEARSTKYEVRDGLVCLTGREELFELNSRQIQIRNQKLETARRYVWLFRLVPWVNLVCVTGSVAGGTPTADDDIDLLVVSGKGRLWISRLAVTFLISLTGKRRKPSDDPRDVNNKLCLNMWLSEEHLVSEQQDEYVANELARMVPLFNKGGTYEKYIRENEWLGGVMPNFYDGSRGLDLGVRINFGRLAVWPSSFLDWLDATLERWQRGRMRQVTRETVEDDLLMFHPRDYRSEVLQKYNERLKLLELE